jgi:heme exporter protein B
VSAYARRVGIVLWKDWLVERRAKSSLNAILFFALILLFLFQFALGPDRERLEAALPGLLWLGFVLAGLLGLGRVFLVESQNDCWEALLLAPGDRSAIYVGKLAANFLLMTLMEAVVLALFGLFYGMDVGRVLGPLAVVVVLGTVGLAAVGTLFGAMTAQVRSRELLFPVLLLPVQVPVLLATVTATQVVLAGQPLAEAAPWLKLLAAADIVYLVLGLLTFEFIFDA